jgi:hypothetical protein
MPNKLAMDVTEEKKLLIASKRRSIYCAVASGYGDTRGFALILMDRVKKPKQLADELSKSFDQARNIRFGVISIDRKTVKLELNRASPGIDKKLIRSLRGTGFSEAEGKSAEENAKGQNGSNEGGPFEQLLKKFGLDNDAALRKQIQFLNNLMKPRPDDPKKVTREIDRRDRTNIEKVRKTLETAQQFGWEALKLKEAHANEMTGPIRAVVRLPANITNTTSDDRVLAILGGLATFLSAAQQARTQAHGG